MFTTIVLIAIGFFIAGCDFLLGIDWLARNPRWHFILTCSLGVLMMAVAWFRVHWIQTDPAKSDHALESVIKPRFEDSRNSAEPQVSFAI